MYYNHDFRLLKIKNLDEKQIYTKSKKDEIDENEIKPVKKMSISKESVKKPKTILDYIDEESDESGTLFYYFPN